MARIYTFRIPLGRSTGRLDSYDERCASGNPADPPTSTRKSYENTYLQTEPSEHPVNQEQFCRRKRCRCECQKYDTSAEQSQLCLGYLFPTTSAIRPIPFLGSCNSFPSHVSLPGLFCEHLPRQFLRGIECIETFVKPWEALSTTSQGHEKPQTTRNQPTF